MSKFYIKAPDGRIVRAPQHFIQTKVDTGGNVVTTFNDAALKPGWTRATDAQWAAKKKGG
jgi:hypothetical protein